jgi:hypothetical protein
MVIVFMESCSNSLPSNNGQLQSLPASFVLPGWALGLGTQAQAVVTAQSNRKPILPCSLSRMLVLCWYSIGVEVVAAVLMQWTYALSRQYMVCVRHVPAVASRTGSGLCSRRLSCMQVTGRYLQPGTQQAHARSTPVSPYFTHLSTPFPRSHAAGCVSRGLGRPAPGKLHRPPAQQQGRPRAPPTPAVGETARALAQLRTSPENLLWASLRRAPTPRQKTSQEETTTRPGPGLLPAPSCATLPPAVRGPASVQAAAAPPQPRRRPSPALRPGGAHPPPGNRAQLLLRQPARPRRWSAARPPSRSGP